MSHLFGRTLRDVPAEAETTNHQLLLRAGLIVQLAAGIYSYLPVAWRALRKIEDIIRDEMDRVGAQEMQMPAIQPLELWQETGRADAYGPVLFRLHDRRDRDLVLAPTHEEAITDIFRKTFQSYRDLPLRVYQIQTKFRDEPRPRGGLVRVRQFIMKDAYSFDIDYDGFKTSYDEMAVAYTNIFRRCGVPVIPVEADSGAVGGKGSQEFIFLSDIGEDRIARCAACGYAANQERAEFSRGDPPQEAPLEMTEVDTPDTTTIAALAERLDIPASKTAKAAFFMADGKPVFAVIRGDLDVNELKLINELGAHDLRPMTDDELNKLGIVPGYASPVGLDAALREQITVIADTSIPPAPNLVAGANKPNTHLQNVNYDRDWSADSVTDIGLARQDDPCPGDCDGAITLDRGIELGHIFHLGTVYTDAMDATVANDQGEQIQPVMGCYGIGVERLLAAVIESNNDDSGIRWPTTIAPFDVHIVAIGSDKDDVAAALTQTETDLEAAGLTVLSDDRNERPGVKFNDADLLGLPIRLTLSPRNLKTNQIELKRRDQQDPTLIDASDLIPAVQQALNDYAANTALPA
jgi:prolyl-tRNA synthetase